MKINLVTLFSQFFETPFACGVLSGALKKEKLQVNFINPRIFTNDVHQTVDDRPFGGGDGMVMKVEPLMKAIESLGDQKGHVVVLSPSGRPFTSKVAKEYIELSKPLTLICGRYSGIDQRFIAEYCDEELSVGDYILSGGEPAALCVIDSLARLLPGVLGNEMSAEEDSFFSQYLECPTFTRPREILNMDVPDVLFSGDHAKIIEFQKKVSLIRTFLKRPDLLLATDKEPLEMAKKWAKTLSENQKKTLGILEINNE
ncbi:MAG: tRNA (guanosine(37)-N1)-methyltransferase TrmD [Bdellovibrionales bacterium]|nr:tRNA (guanosine(37)-N1)-methyltransferase TrmD [Bdellovibrionales bacterium]